MHESFARMLTILFLFLFLTAPAVSGADGDPIVVGVPSSLKTLEASEGLNAIILAAEEINARGGVKVGEVMRPLKIESIDTRGGEPGGAHFRRSFGH